MIFFEQPGRIELRYWEDESRVRRRVIEQFFDVDFVLQVIGDQAADGLDDFPTRLIQRDATVNVNRELIGYRVDRSGARIDVGDGDRRKSLHFVVAHAKAHAAIELADL